MRRQSIIPSSGGSVEIEPGASIPRQRKSQNKDLALAEFMKWCFDIQENPKQLGLAYNTFLLLEWAHWSQFYCTIFKPLFSCSFFVFSNHSWVFSKCLDAYSVQEFFSLFLWWTNLLNNHILQLHLKLLVGSVLSFCSGKMRRKL